MFVKSIQFGSGDNDRRGANPDSKQLESYLRSLDGESEDSVILESSGKSYMGVSGGRNNRYVVAGYIEGCGSFIFAGGKHGGGTLQVVVCGDFNSYASENVASLDDAIAAARVFCENGELSPQFRWENKPRTTE